MSQFQLQPEAYLDFEVYEGKVNYLGVAKATQPNIAFLSQTITGAGIGGNVDAVMTGMMEAMTLELSFRSANGAALQLLRPEKHSLELRIAEQQWDPVNVKRVITADKFVYVCVPKSLNLGAVAPASMADVTASFAVYYFAGFEGQRIMWEIDPYNYKCVIDNKDYMADIRRALGK